MLLVIDVGNTQIKTAVFEENTIIQREFVSFDDWQNKIKNILKTYSRIKEIFVSSVGKLEKEAFFDFKKDWNLVFVSHNLKFPFVNLYTTPNTLGMDRMVLATGAVIEFPNVNRLIIDAGTCITYDFVDMNDNYLGGAISPGIRLRYQSLNNYTSKLPFLEKEFPKNIIGNSTNQSIHSGVVNGVLNEIDGFINNYYNNYENFIIILTGGDADFLAKRLKNTIFANPNFLLESLNKLYQYNQND